MSRKRCAVNMACETSRSVAETWEEVAVSLQQTFCETLGDSGWDSYKITEHCYMHKKVGFALFGLPVEADYVEYDSCKLEKIKQICKIIVEQDNHNFLQNNSETWMSIIFVCLAVEKTGNHIEVATEPVFRVPRYCNENDISVNFIDRNCRVYKSWEDYLQNNKLPSCSYCYPKNGVYHLNVNQQVDVEFGKTPASKLSSKICSGLDLATTIVSAGTIGLACAAVSFPISAPVLATSVITNVFCSAYGISRNTKEIIDRKKHKESIGLTDSRSRNCWLSLVGNAVGILSCGASRIIPKIAQSGTALHVEGRVCVAALSVTSCTVSGINVANEILNLDEKRRKNDIHPSDVAQLISAVLFFGHSVMSTKSAVNLIRESRQGRLEKFVSSVRSTNYKKVFSDVAEKVVGKKSEFLENGKIIRSMKYIEDLGESFLNNVVVFKPVFNSASFTIDESGIRQCIAYFKELILNATRNFVTRISNSCTQFGFQSIYTENLPTASGSTSTPVAVAGFNLQGHILKLLRGIGEFNIPLVLELGVKIFSDLNYPLGRSICEVLNMIYMFVKEVVKDMENQYLEQLHKEQSLLGSNFSQVSFDQKYKISGERFEYFCSVALRAVNLVGEVFNMLKEACLVTCRKEDNTSVRVQSSERREIVIPWEFTNSSENMPLTKDQALQIARDLINEDLNCNNSVVAFAESELFVIIDDKSISFNVVRIKYLAEDKVIFASVMC